jgi:molybdopterin synthase sulfur carrier subunit
MKSESSCPEVSVSVRVLLPNAFQKHTNGAREIQSHAGNLPELITDIETSFPALKAHLRDEQGQVRRFINFYVNEEDIRFLGNEKYTFKDGDEVLVIPSIAGGCWDLVSENESRFVQNPRATCCSYCGQEDCICC